MPHCRRFEQGLQFRFDRILTVEKLHSHDECPKRFSAQFVQRQFYQIFVRANDEVDCLCGRPAIEFFDVAGSVGKMIGILSPCRHFAMALFKRVPKSGGVSQSAKCSRCDGR